jgi:hypothetical protein
MLKSSKKKDKENIHLLPSRFGPLVPKGQPQNQLKKSQMRSWRTTRAGLLQVIAAAGTLARLRSRHDAVVRQPCSGLRLGRAHALSLGDRSAGSPESLVGE